MKTKNISLLSIALFTMTIGVNKVLSQSAVPHSSYGVWNRGGDPSFDPNKENYDYIVGVTKGPSWAEIQPDNSTSYDWSEMQEAIDLAHLNNQLVALKINVGPQCPDWIYNNGVHMAKTTGHKFSKFPYYLDQDYINFYYAMIDEFAKFIYSQPQEKQDLLSFIFPQNGATGDEVPYKGNLTTNNYSISDAQWKNFRINSWNHWKSAFRDGKSRPIPFLFNDMYPDTDEWNWVRDNIGNDFGVKNANAFARGHHLTKEKDWHNEFHKYLVNPKGLELFNRAEMDQSWSKPIYKINTNLGFYWGAIGGLSTGLSVWDVTTSALEEARNNPSIQESFRFFTKYAGQIDPAVSTKAFIALHEGLNSADTDKFPERIYGEANKNNTARYNAICNDPYYSNHGAQMDDSKAVTDGQVSQRRSQTGYNDAGWEIWPTNYARFITQVNPEEESIGLFRIGGKIDSNSPIYSRFARSFENSSGKNAMYFKMQDDFFSTAAGKVAISVIYYDKNAGSTWQLKYDAGKGNFKTAYTITCDGSGTWKTREITVTDAVMLHNGLEEADFALINNDSKDDIFHMIEIEHLGEGSPSPDKVSITSPAYGSLFDSGDTITVIANGFDNQGIEKIRFKVDDGDYFDQTIEPYTNIFTGLANGEHTLVVQMVDNEGNTILSEEVVIIIEGGDTTEDNVSITFPADGDIFKSGADIIVTANGFDNQGIDKMRFKVDDGGYNNVTTQPYTHLFTGLADGKHTLAVQMKDNQGNRILSEEITITIENLDDNVSITSPMDDEIFASGADITVTANGFDSQGIEKMRFKVDDGDYNNVSTQPYTHVFAGLADGKHTLVVQMKDNEGTRTLSEKITITIDSSVILDRSSSNKLGVNEFRIYPTIVDDVLNWEFNSTVQQIRVFGLSGRKVLHKSVNNSGSVNLSRLEQGLYLVHFLVKDIGIIHQIIIKK